VQPAPSAAALLAANTPSTNAGNRALVGSAAPYVTYSCDGSAWTTTSATPGAVSGPITLSNANDGEPLICTGTPVITINSGLKPNFGLPISGTFTTAGSATITDERATTGTPRCCLVQTDTTGAGATYELWGTK